MVYSKEQVVSHKEFEKRVVAKSTTANKPFALIAPEFGLPWLSQWHAFGDSSIVHDLATYRVNNLDVRGPGVLSVGGAYVTSSEFTPAYVRKHMESERYTRISASDDNPTQEIVGSCIILAGWGVTVYGHFLIEMLFRLEIAKRSVSYLEFASCSFLMDNRAPKWLLEILAEFFGIDAARIHFFDRFDDIIRVKEAILPTLASADGAFHPFAALMIDEFVSGIGLRPTKMKRVFVSRRTALPGNSVERRCVNARELEQIAESEFDFVVTDPQTLSWREQIAIMQSAETLVGEYGSGMHNAIFSMGGTTVGSIGVLGLEQSNIGALRGHFNAYLAVEESKEYSVDADRFRRFMGALLKNK
jgi:capsular polysaccharide biosynthesis protein